MRVGVKVRVRVGVRVRVWWALLGGLHPPGAISARGILIRAHDILVRVRGILLLLSACGIRLRLRAYFITWKTRQLYVKL